VTSRQVGRRGGGGGTSPSRSRYPQGGADAMQGCRGVGPAVAGRGAGQDREGGLHVIQAQLAQQDPTEVGNEVRVVAT
jgi:hypothetical protein